MSAAYAVDGTKFASDGKTFNDWQVIEFAMPKGILYRLASTALADKNIYLTFDIGTAKRCAVATAVMIQTGRRYSEHLDEGMVPMSYQLTNSKEQLNEISNTHISSSDKTGTLFIELKKLNVEYLRNARGKGKLAVWITAGVDVPASENIYFSVAGVDKAFEYALAACKENIPQ